MINTLILNRQQSREENEIVYIVPYLHQVGGIQKFALSTFTYLRRVGYGVRIMNWRADWIMRISDFISKKVDLSMELYSIALNFMRLKDNFASFLLHFWHLDPAMFILKKSKSRKYIVSCHGTELLRSNMNNLRRVLYPSILRHAQIIHANSNFTKSLVERIVNANISVEVIPPPIDYKYLSSFTDIKSEGDDEIIIGSICRLTPRKNILNVIKALSLLKEEYNVKFKYYLAGDGPERRKILRELNRANFEWSYFGRISEREKIEFFYPSLNVFVLPTLTLPREVEGFGIVYLEANAFGIPVVASKTGGVIDAVKEGISGVFADPKSPQDIAMKILDLIENRKRYALSAKSWASQFDLDKIMPKYIKLIRSIL